MPNDPLKIDAKDLELWLGSTPPQKAQKKRSKGQNNFPTDSSSENATEFEDSNELESNVSNRKFSIKIP